MYAYGFSYRQDEEEPKSSRRKNVVVYLRDFAGQRLLRRFTPRNDILLCQCERSEAISA